MGAVRKLNAIAMACDVVARNLKAPIGEVFDPERDGPRGVPPIAEPRGVDPGGEQTATERPFDWVERGGDVVEKEESKT